MTGRTTQLFSFAETTGGTAAQQRGSLPLGLAVLSAGVVTASVWAIVWGLRRGGVVSLRRASSRRSLRSQQLEQLAWVVLPALIGWMFAMVLLGAVLPERVALSVDLVGIVVIIVGAFGLLAGAAVMDWLAVRHTNEERVARGGTPRRRLLNPFQGAVLDIGAAVVRTMVFAVLTTLAWRGAVGHWMFATTTAPDTASTTMTTDQLTWMAALCVYMVWAGVGVWLRYRHRQLDWQMQERLMRAEDDRFLAATSGAQSEGS